MDVAVENEPVDALSPSSVANRFDRCRMFDPAAQTREGFGADDRVAVEFCDGGRQFRRVKKRNFAAPKFAHGDVALSPNLHALERPPIGFDRKFHSVLVAAFAKLAVVIFGDQIANGSTEVPQETFADFATVNIVSSQGRQILDAFVAA